MNWLRVAAGLGFLGVALGAFGAHGLRGKVPDAMLAVWQTGVLYHLIHAVALLALALYARVSRLGIRTPALLFTLGVVLFSGSLYLMTLTGARQLGMVTPLGGLSFLAGWVAVLVTLGKPEPAAQ